ncbi:aminotransferase class IV [Brevibacterium sp. UCMA 11752]|uniref:aminotransferase class IV n=1 Tax=Brevibacterium sp. UCMA 11752 TaxID=2745946 RepID=UPI001F3A7C2C|nr:aminotransferase class IV [Brevibacterium sp. UCMA 11752]MCF2587743.1 aminotransferase class IV [Brevibacterium sp. UCMA 11752]
MRSWTWDPLRREFVSGGATGELRLADSWFVGDGRVRAFERHRRRFSKAALELGCTDADSTDFCSALIDLIPRSGEWFPRVEVLGDDEPALGFRLRPVPSRTDELDVWIPPFSDPRQHPKTKGPDIGRLGELRTRAHEEHRCDEVLLVDEHGFAVESATSSLLWWEDETLCVPHPELAQLPGVTTSLIQDEARRRSIRIEYRRVRPSDLLRHEVWLVNALHGIRRIRAFSGQLNCECARATKKFWEWKAWLAVQMTLV